MNVLLIIPRYRDGEASTYQHLFPLGLAYVSASMKLNGHQVTCLNINKYSGSLRDIIEHALKMEYEVVCTGGLSPDFNRIRQIVLTIRAVSPYVKIVLGGGLCSGHPEFILHALSPDYVVYGEGDITIRELLNCIGHGGDIKRVKGVAYKAAGVSDAVIVNAPQPQVDDLDELPFPDMDGLGLVELLDHAKPSDDLNYYVYDKPRVYPIIGSRSCPYQCTFCFHPLGNKYRQRSVANIMLELDQNVRKYRVNSVMLLDECFSQKTDRVYDFCDRISKLRDGLSWELKWMTCLRVCDVNDEMLCRMKDAGCFLISYGFESYSDIVLKSMKKNIASAQIALAIDLTLKHGIAVQGNFIFGDLAETLATAAETLDFWKKRGRCAVNLGFIVPYPGSYIYKNAVERGIIKDDEYLRREQYAEPFNFTHGMSDAEYNKMVAMVAMTKYRYTPLAYLRDKKVHKDGTWSFWLVCPCCRSRNQYTNYSKLNFVSSCDTHCRVCGHHHFVVTFSGYIISRFMGYLMSVLPIMINVWLKRGFDSLRFYLSGRKYRHV